MQATRDELLSEDDEDSEKGLGFREIETELTLDDFMREYKKYMRAQKSVVNQFFNKEPDTKGVSKNTIVSSYTLGRINKKERQEELKQVLMETMQLTTKLKE